MGKLIQSVFSGKNVLSMPEHISPGTLYIISTPIGNLEDLSRRAERILGGVQVIAAEDTRTTGILLRHLGLHVPMVSCFSHNERRRAEELVVRMRAGDAVALVTDAGTPGVSDPAYAVIRRAVSAGLTVVPVPGPSAALAALVASGLPTDRFVFEGFLPLKKGRQSKWKQLATEERTIIVYESPQRIVRAVEEVLEHLGNRHIAVARELTKKFEEVVRGLAAEVLKSLRERSPRGEFVLVIAGSGFKSGIGREDGDGQGETNSSTAQET